LMKSSRHPSGSQPVEHADQTPCRSLRSPQLIGAAGESLILGSAAAAGRRRKCVRTSSSLRALARSDRDEQSRSGGAPTLPKRLRHRRRARAEIAGSAEQRCGSIAAVCAAGVQTRLPVTVFMVQLRRPLSSIAEAGTRRACSRSGSGSAFDAIQVLPRGNRAAQGAHRACCSEQKEDK